MMVNEKTITCIVCPVGCKIVVKTNGSKVDVLKGSRCKQGLEYVRNEAVDPRRTLTTSVLVKNGEWPLVSVKTSEPVPKDQVFSILQRIKETTVDAPVTSGDVIIKNVLGVDIVATRSVKKKKRG
jgi:CxxC motif-containing protein